MEKSNTYIVYNENGPLSDLESDLVLLGIDFNEPILRKYLMINISEYEVSVLKTKKYTVELPTPRYTL